MDTAGSSSPAPVAAAAAERNQKASAMSRMRKWWLCLAASLQESYTYVKAILVAQAKKMSARSEKEAAEADLQASKMQVEAADAAEDARKNLHKSI